MEKWEYKYQNMKNFMDAKPMIEKLNELGSDGWQCVFKHRSYAIFKKRIVVRANER
jgi:hypothetical protein